MIRIRFLPLVVKQIMRRPTRSFLTVAGVTIAMFLFVTIQTLQMAVREATRVTAKDTKLVVYRENRFCPATSRLPEYYQGRILKVPGVAGAIPVKVVVSNCASGLDVITFRGVPDEELPAFSGKWRVLDGSLDDWRKRSDAALVGGRLAQRRGFTVGQSFDAAGVTVTVAGIIESTEPQDQNVAYVHLNFLQLATRQGGLGVVTQFDVTVSDPTQLEKTAKLIDEEFRTEAEPTQTRPEKAFVAQAGSDIVEIVAFTRYLAWGCVFAVLALIANTNVLAVQDRIKEHAVLQTLGYRGGLIARLVTIESICIGVAGGVAGAMISMVLLTYGNLTLSTEGVGVDVTTRWPVFAAGLVLSSGVGLLAALVPAWQASRRQIAQSFRAV